MSKPFLKMPSKYIQWDSPIGWAAALVAALGAVLLAAASNWLWIAFFLIAGTLCSSAYFQRCSRLHCRITAPLFLLSAFYLTAVEIGLIPFMGNTWFLVVVIGTIALSFLAEMIFGKEINRGDKRLASH